MLGKLIDLMGFGAKVSLSNFDIEFINLDHALAMATAELRKPTRRLGLSFGDRACLALAQQRNATELTADRPWMELELDISIECIR
jgi:PIN domain nuclease of toxin-antitoxin system